MKLYIKSLVYVAVLVLSFQSLNAYCNNDNTKCGGLNVGVGGIYYGLNASNSDLSNYGGYLNVEGWDTTNRFKIAAILKIGGGVSKYDGLLLAREKSNKFIMIDFALKAGVNVLTYNAPLYINFIAGYENYQTKGLYSQLYYFGGELEGAIPTGSKLSIDYSAGGTLINGWYEFPNTYRANIDLANVSYMAYASLGFSYQFSERWAYYMKVIGKYQSFSESKHALINSVDYYYPKSNNFIGMVELGFKWK